MFYLSKSLKSFKKVLKQNIFSQIFDFIGLGSGIEVL